ncbi:MAG: class I SAM-dependent methyltransferase [Chloroflexota bacterium]
MLNKLLFHQFPTIKSLLTRLQYEFLSTLNLSKDVMFMNFGYTAHHEGQDPLVLEPDDEIHRYPMQLYHHVARHVDWSNVDALEVSSGRGGGASFIMRYFKPRSYVGVDFSAKAIEFCRNHHIIDGLRFEHGNAEDLQFPDNSFDVVVNVEASLYYPNIHKFFQHVRRVLKPGGYFLYTDLRYEEKTPEWHTQIEEMGLKVIKKEDITDNVLKAMELDRERRIQLVKTYIPRILQKQFYHFAGLDLTSPTSVSPHLEQRRYWYFVLQKI